MSEEIKCSLEGKNSLACSNNAIAIAQGTTKKNGHTLYLCPAHLKQFENQLDNIKQLVNSEQTEEKPRLSKSSEKEKKAKKTAAPENAAALGEFTTSGTRKVYTTQNFPSLEGIAYAKKDLATFFLYKRVYARDEILLELLKSAENGIPIGFFGEPGDGKSLSAIIFLKWLTLQRPIEFIDGDGNQQKVFGFKNIDKNRVSEEARQKGWGFEYETLNVSPETSPTELYGGYAPESIGGSVADREKNVEWGKVSRCIRDAHYLLLDEINRGETETFARLMGALSNPYNYEVQPLNAKFEMMSEDQERFDFVIVVTFNTGDKGNFPMSFAFKRRFSMNALEYDAEEIPRIFNFIYSQSPTKLQPYTNEEETVIKARLAELGVPTVMGSPPVKVIDEILSRFSSFFSRTCKEIFASTHEWVKEKLVLYGAGIAHIQRVLEDLSQSLDLFMFYSEEEYKKKNPQMQMPMDANQLEKLLFSNNNVRNFVQRAILRHIINVNTDEGDKFRKDKVIQRANPLVEVITNDFTNALKPIFNYLPAEEIDSVREAVNIIMKFNNSVFRKFLKPLLQK